MDELDENPIGRPTDYNQDLADKICHLLSQGMSMRSVCAMDGMPVADTMFRWLRTNKEFKEQYAIAKQESSDAMAEDVLDIADNGSNDWMEKRYGDNEFWVTNGEALQRSRLRVDTRKWLMSKMKPKKYGDKIDVTTDGKPLPTPIYGGQSINPIQEHNSNQEDIPTA